MDNSNKVFLIILDGYGLRDEIDGNAVKLSNTPFLQTMMDKYSSTVLKSSGSDVGLPDGLMGNSEVGHLNLGAGRVVHQYISRIDYAISTGDIFTNKALLTSVRYAHDNGTAWHLIGLVSRGGVHSCMKHLFVLLEAAKREGVSEVYLHALMDGRDTPPDSGLGFVQEIEAKMQELGVGKIASVCGRYWGMDRDRNWDRIEKAYRMLTKGEGNRFHSAVEAIEDSYEQGITDEFIEPSLIVDKMDRPISQIKKRDSVFLFNFRADRAREITRALTKEKFRYFSREYLDLHFASMTQYHKDMTFLAGFPPVHHYNILGEVISNAGLKQFRIAETEKYAHVTYFFNGGWEEPFPLEDRLLVSSPKVTTYDLQPEMSAPKVAKEVLTALDKDYSFILLNFANPDMVGHTGVLPAAIKALEALDPLVEQLVDKAISKDYSLIITADHGNCERMISDSGGSHTAHTTNFVPFVLIPDNGSKPKLRNECRLADVAPTIMELMALPQPDEMDGESILAAAADYV